MKALRLACLHAAIAATGFVLASCTITDLKQDLDRVEAEFGYFKGQVVWPDDNSNLLVALFRRDESGMSIANVRAANPGESLYVLVARADYTLLAFADANGDFKYQPGEAAARIDDPLINWLSELQIEDRVDYDALQVQKIEFSEDVVLDRDLDLSLQALHGRLKASANFLRVASWDDDRFSDENVRLGMWEPGAFQRDIGFGLYLRSDFDAEKKAVLLVHGINDSPRVFQSLVEAIPDDYQVLLFHYPSGFPLEYTSYALAEGLDELIRRHPLPQLDVVAHSMGGLVSKGMLLQADDGVRQRINTFVSIASPFGGHAGATIGIKWAPVVAPVWWAMAPDSPYLTKIAGLDLSQGPRHHLIFTMSQETGGNSEGDDGVVTLTSQLTPSAQRNATAIYGVADNHTGVMINACTAALVAAILEDSTSRTVVPEC